jgi:glycosyltransferase involved in cell wall biosynthesis
MVEPNENANILFENAIQIGIRTFTVSVKRKLDYNSIKNIRRIIKNNNITIIHSHDFKSDFYALIASIGLKVKRVTTAHGSTRDSWLKRVYLAFNEIIIYRYYNSIIAVSNELKIMLLKRGIKGEKIFVIQNGLDLNFIKNVNVVKNFEEPLPVPASAIVFTVIGRLFPDKGHRFFLKAFDSIKHRYSNVYALIVGDGPSRQDIERQIQLLGLSNRVYVCGMRSDIWNVYSRTQYLVIPSLREGIPYVLLEAMAHHITILSTSVGDIPMIIKDGESGFIVPPADSNALSTRMVDLLENEEHAKTMAEAAYKVLIDRFSSDRMVKCTEELYNTIAMKLKAC